MDTPYNEKVRILNRAVAVLLVVITMLAGVTGCGNEAIKKDDLERII